MRQTSEEVEAWRVQGHIKKFEENYKWSSSLGGKFFFGTDEISLESFDGAIGIRVEGGTMASLHMRPAASPTSEQAAIKSPRRAARAPSMLKVGLKLHKIGLMPEGGFEFPTWLSLLMRTSGIDYSQGMHLHEFSGAAGMVLHADHVYEIELELAIDASARFDPDTKRWVVAGTRHQGVFAGIQPRGSLAKMKIASFFVGLLKTWWVEISHDVSYCFVNTILGTCRGSDKLSSLWPQTTFFFMLRNLPRAKLKPILCCRLCSTKS